MYKEDVKTSSFLNMQTIRLSICSILFICLTNTSFAKEVLVLNKAFILIMEPVYSIDRNISIDTLPQNTFNKNKFISAITAFPFPLGFMGAHRIMLGTKPWIPVVYVATLGGCFGLLPLIDFCVIVFSKDIERYENNPHIFMWVK